MLDDTDDEEGKLGGEEDDIELEAKWSSEVVFLEHALYCVSPLLTPYLT